MAKDRGDKPCPKGDGLPKQRKSPEELRTKAKGRPPQDPANVTRFLKTLTGK